jgi:pilus assembly protein Flp/PilA
MRKITRKLVGDRKGATAIEYGLIAALVSVAIIGGLQVVGPAINGAFVTVGNQVNAANAAAP